MRVIGLLLAFLLGLAIIVVLWFLATATPAFAHDWYSDLSDGRGLNCCGGNDCMPIAPEDVRQGDGGVEALYGGEWWPVGPPDNRRQGILPLISPDGLPHACKMVSEPFIRCLILPGDV